jgi:hypothetical protein
MTTKVPSRRAALLIVTSIALFGITGATYGQPGRGTPPAGQRVLVVNKDTEAVPTKIMNPTVSLAPGTKVEVSNLPAPSSGTTTVAIATFLKAGQEYRMQFAPGITVQQSSPGNQLFRVAALGSDGWIQVTPSAGGNSSWLNLRYVVWMQ